MAGANLSTAGSLASLVKYLYPKGRVEFLGNKAHPFLQMLVKKSYSSGSSVWQPVSYGTGGGASNDYATAIAGTSNTKSKHFVVPFDNIYQKATIDHKSALLMLKPGDGSFVNAKKHEIDGKILDLTNVLVDQLFRSGSGSLGTISSGSDVSTSTISLTNPLDANSYEVGDVIELSDADGSGSLRSGTIAITGIDRSAGTLTFAAALDGSIAAAATGDYIFKDGTHNDAVPGLAGYLPQTAPTAGDSFLSMDRSADPVRLAGSRVDGSGVAVEDAFLDILTEVQLFSGTTPDCIVCNPKIFNKAAKNLGDLQRHTPRNKMEWGFNFLEINAGGGVTKVVTDFKCPIDKAYALSLDTWKLYYAGQSHVFLEPEDMMRFSTTADEYAIPIFSYPALACSAPGENGVLYGLSV